MCTYKVASKIPKQSNVIVETQVDIAANVAQSDEGYGYKYFHA